MFACVGSHAAGSVGVVNLGSFLGECIEAMIDWMGGRQFVRLHRLGLPIHIDDVREEENEFVLEIEILTMANELLRRRIGRRVEKRFLVRDYCRICIYDLRRDVDDNLSSPAVIREMFVLAS